MEEKKGNGCNQLAIVLKYKDFKTNYGEPEEIHSVTRWCKVEEVGQSNLFFDTKNVDGREGSFVSESGATLEVSAIMEQTYTRWFNEGDIISLEVHVYLDDDNTSAPENRRLAEFISVVKLAVKKMKRLFKITVNILIFLQVYKLLGYFF